ncbi:hypothetical protein EW146_g3170 [Bondarzewia mesenterica]|uniref:Vacuolar sorting protein 39/Transforming growth factor beta receptor-associated domain-containing protein n=1 Tax=Bondarzewia mesenterica TaxID=1095465 RepID=A0A4S4LYD2_9AGAM|nr:hypothetical protein EW146_g3170 [Bondarzewia mesenterica]
MARRSTFPRSSVLVLGVNSVQSLLPATLISQAESLLESHRIQDVVELADQQRKKLQSKLTVDEDEADELRYVYQRIGFQFFNETRFEDAGYNLFEGNLDPRILISYFPDLRGSLFSPDVELDMFSGVAEHMLLYDSVDDIIRNYSPHLAPNTRSAPPTAELRRLLGIEALEMLETYLKKWKQIRGDNGTPEIRSIVDTILAKLFANGEKTADLYTLIDESANLVVPELEPVLQSTGQYNALCKIYQKQGDDAKLLEVWSKLAEEEWTDADIPDPLSKMFTFLAERRNRQLTQQWGIWLTKKDSERALKVLLTSQGSTKRAQKSEDDVAMLRQIREANPEAGIQFLEYLVLQKRNTDRTLHSELALICVDQLLTYISDDAVSKLWRAKAASYASNPSSTPFLSYFAATTPDSPAKRARIRTALFLQSSVSYDAQPVRERLASQEKVLALEVAIVEGKLGNHHAALSILAHTMRDHVSAEAYCTTCGSVVPPRVASTLAEKYELGPWVGPSSSKAPGANGSAEEETRRLLRLLLEVYMSGGSDTSERERAQTSSSSPPPGSSTFVNASASLLNSQAVNFDVVDVSPHPPLFLPVPRNGNPVLERVPPTWPLPTLSAFLASSLRRSLHARHEDLLIKGISMSQNLAISDTTHTLLRAQGALVEEALPESDEDNDEKGEGGHPYVELDEKVGLHAPVIAVPVPRRGGVGGIGVGMSASYGSSVTDADGGGGLR